MAEKSAKLQDPATIMWLVSDFKFGDSVVLKPNYTEIQGFQKKGFWIYDRTQAEKMGAFPGNSYPIDNPYYSDDDIPIAYTKCPCLTNVACLMPASAVEAYMAQQNQSHNPKRLPSPATLEAEELSTRLTRLRELIAVDDQIAAHKTAGKALTEKHAALVAELYPKAKAKVKK